jgi:hypothetical protein
MAGGDSEHRARHVPLREGTIEWALSRCFSSAGEIEADRRAHDRVEAAEARAALIRRKLHHDRERLDELEH